MADEKTSSLLRQWNFERYIEVFKEQEIDYEALICLKKKDLLALLPKAGLRAKFSKKLEAHKLTEVTILSQTLSFDESMIAAISNISISKKEINSSEYILDTACDNIENVPSSNGQEDVIKTNSVQFNPACTLPANQQQSVNAPEHSRRPC